MKHSFLPVLIAAALIAAGCKPPAQPPTEGLSSLKVQTGGDLAQLELSHIKDGEKQRVESATAEAVKHTSPFFQLCTGDVLGLSFPEKLVVADDDVDDPLKQQSGEKIVGPFDMGGKPQMWAARIRKYRCTEAELDAMLRDLHDMVMQIAGERGCRLIGEPNYEFNARSNDFNVTYTLGEWHGSVAVHSRKVDPSQPDSDPAVYSVDFNVHETYIPPRKQ
jgi:hypothetical protein